MTNSSQALPSRVGKIFAYFILFIFIAVLVTDALVDRKKLVDMALEPINQNPIFTIEVGEVEHTIINPGYVDLAFIQLKSKQSDDLIRFSDLSVQLSLWSLFSNVINIESITLTNFDVRLSQAFVEQIKIWSQQQSANQAQNNQPTKAFGLLLSSMRLEQINVIYQAFDQTFVVNNAKFELADVQVDDISAAVIEQLNAQAKLAVGLISLSKDGLPQHGAEQLNASVTIERGQVPKFIMELKTLGGRVDLQASVESDKGKYSVLVESLNLTNLSINLPANAEPSQEQSFPNPKPQPATQLPIDVLHIKQSKLTNIQLAQPTENVNISDISGTLRYITLVENGFPIQLFQVKSGSSLKLDGGKARFQSFEIDNWHFDAISNDQSIIVERFDVITPKDKGVIKLAGQVIQLDEAKVFRTDLLLVVNKLAVEPMVHLMPKGAVMPTGHFSTRSRIRGHYSVLAGFDGALEWSSSGPNIEGIDLDTLLSSYQESQQTSLVDVGSFLLTGPLGLVATNIVELGAGAMSSGGGQTQLQLLEMQADINGLLISVESGRLKTEKHKVGFKGAIDTEKKEFNKFSVAILNDLECAVVEQTLDGPFSEVSGAIFDTTAGAITSPITTLFNGLDLSEDCPKY